MINPKGPNCENVVSIKKELAEIEKSLLYRKYLQEKDCNEIKERILKIKENIDPIEREIRKLKEEKHDNELEKFKDGMEADCMAHDIDVTLKENKLLDSKNRNLKEMNQETISKEVPSLSIQMNSLLDLNQQEIGWKIISGLSDQLSEIMKKEMVTASVIGMYDVGKSWFCNEFTGQSLTTSGFNQRTDGLNFYFPTEKGKLIGIIDTPGSNEAIRVTDKALIEKVEAAYEREGNVETQKDISEDEKYMFQYKLLKNDSRILQDLKQRFIAEVTDVTILICNKLSEKEQENIYKVIKHYKKIQKDRKSEDDSKKSNRETYLYIVHNYKMLTEVAQVEKQIERDLFQSFQISKPSPLFNDSSKRKEFVNRHQYMYQDQFGIPHLILAAKGSPAGDYYNRTTIGFLRDKIDLIQNRTSTDVKKLFLNFCEQNLPKILKQDIKLKLKPDETAIINPLTTV